MEFETEIVTLKQILEYSFFEVNDFKLSVSKVLSLLIIYTVAKAIVFIIRTLLRKAGKNSSILDKGKQYTILQLVRYFVYIIAIIVSFQSLGLDISLLIASSAALFVGIGLGLQSIFKDITSGIFLLFEKTIQVGDLIETDKLVGRVLEIGIRTSKVKTRDDIMIIIPNSFIISEKVTNWSAGNKRTRFIITVGVAYGSDTKKVKDILIECAQKHKFVDNELAPFVRFFDFGESALMFDLLFWSEYTWEVERTKSDIRFEIDEAFRKNGITIPFPQRDLHLKSAPQDWGNKQSN